MPPPIEALGAIGFLDGVAAVRDDRQRAFVFDLLSNSCTIIGFISSDRERRVRCGQNLFNDLAVVDLSAGHREA